MILTLMALCLVIILGFALKQKFLTDSSPLNRSIEEPQSKELISPANNGIDSNLNRESTDGQTAGTSQSSPTDIVKPGSSVAGNEGSDTGVESVQKNIGDTSIEKNEKNEKNDGSTKGADSPNSSSDKMANEGAPAAKIESDFKASPGEGSCEEQWLRLQKTMKSQSELVYMSNFNVQKPLAPEIPVNQVETIVKSDGNSIKRKVVFESDHPTASLVFSTMELSESVSTIKSDFLETCKAGKQRAVLIAGFVLSNAKVVDVSDETIQVGAGNFKAHRFKMEGTIQVGKRKLKVPAIVWMARTKPGLVLKQTIKFSTNAFPDHGSITISSQLAGTKGVF